MDLHTIRYEVTDRVATITLDRPDRLNAWTARMATEYRWCLGTAEEESDVRVVVVTGAGRGFCAGADTRALDAIAGSGEYRASDAPEDDSPAVRVGVGVRPDFEHDFTYPLGLRKPVIAAVNGAAAGVGFVLMCFCDIRFAAAGAKLTTSFARLGLPAEHGVSWMLSRLVGAGRAADLLLSARVVLAEEAERMGLVNRVLRPDELLPFTMDYARAIASDCSPSSLLALKRQLYCDLLGDLDTSARDSMERMLRMMREPDFTEGVTALKEKRPPLFKPPRT